MLAKPQWPQDAFEQWWEAYPRRVAKKYARKCFDRLRKSEDLPFEVLISAVRFYAKSVIGKDMKYVAHPATWLNAGRWDDDEAALLDCKVLAPALPMKNGQVMIRQGSPQALAWAKHRGHDFPWGRSGIWAVDSEWPPE